MYETFLETEFIKKRRRVLNIKKIQSLAATSVLDISLNKQIHPNSTLAQHSRILRWLTTKGSLSTIEARDELKIMHPAGRIANLKSLGYRIETIICNEETSDGISHRVARYFIKPHGASHVGGQ